MWDFHVQACHTAFKTLDMIGQAEECAVPDVHDVIGCIGVQESPVQHRYFCTGDRDEYAVDERGA